MKVYELFIKSLFRKYDMSQINIDMDLEGRISINKNTKFTLHSWAARNGGDITTNLNTIQIIINNFPEEILISRTVGTELVRTSGNKTAVANMFGFSRRTMDTIIDRDNETGVIIYKGFTYQKKGRFNEKGN